MELRRLALSIVLLASAAIASAQSRRLVEINVVVRDKAGPVADLRKEDFTVLDNGKPRRIDVFAVTDSRSPQQATGGAAPPGVVSNIRNAAGAIAQTATVLLLDFMNSSTDANREKDAINQFVRYLRTVREGDGIALFVLGYQLHAIQDFTNANAVLLRAAAGLKALDEAGIEVSSRAQLATLLGPPPISAPGGGVTFTAAPGFGDTNITTSATNRSVATADAFEAIARYLYGVPGRKNLVWMSSGAPFQPAASPLQAGSKSQPTRESADEFSRQLNRALKALVETNVAVYPVYYLEPNGPYPETITRIATATGGRFERANDVLAAVRTALADGSVSYTLGFDPGDERLDGKLHELKVAVNRKDLEVRHRSGHYSSAQSLDEKERQSIAAELLASHVNSSQIGLAALAEPASGNPGSYNVTISIEAGNLAVTQKGARRSGQLRLSMRLESLREKNVQAGIIPLDFSEQQFQNILKRGFVVRQAIQAAADDRLRIVVQDQATGLAGALWLPLQGR
jgi:VWFA-related protein